jgi:hypothetical protein
MYAFLVNEIPINCAFEGLDGEEDIANQTQMVKGMSHSEGMFAKIHDQVFGAENLGLDVSYANGYGLFP